MIYRSFTLYDENGTSKSLNGEPEGSKLYFENPTGLGFNLAPTFANIGSGFFKNVSSDKIPQLPIVGDLVVSDYAEYSAFVRWVLKAKKLYFAYRPTPTSDEYRCEVAIDYLTKTEKNAGASLRCPISFKPLTPWYTETVVSYEFQDVSGVPVAQISKATGDVPAAIKFDVTSASRIYNLQVRLDTDDLSEERGYFEINGDILPQGGTISYSSAYGDCYITKSNGTTVTSLIDSVDITGNPWLRIDSDSDYKLSIIAPGIDASSIVSVRVYNYYRSV